MPPPDTEMDPSRAAGTSEWVPPDFRPRLSYHLVSMSGALFLLLDPLCLVVAAWFALRLGPAGPGAGGLFGAFDGDLLPAALVAAVLAAFTLYDPRFGLQALPDLLTDTPSELIEACDVIVVSHGTPQFVAALAERHPQSTIIDLVRLPAELRDQAGYRGICW